MDDFVILDVSYCQGDIEENKTIEAGVKALLIRAGSINAITGVCYEDYCFYINCDKFQRLIPIGCYWYYRPEWDPIKQADYFCDLLDEVWWYVPPVADIECNDKNIRQYDFQRWLYKFLIRVEERAKKTPMIYTRAEFWNRNLGDVPWASNYPLWIARYNDLLNHPWGDGKFKPLPWDTFLLWQKSADGNGLGEKYGMESRDVCFDVCSLRLADFYHRIGWGVIEPDDHVLKVEYSIEGKDVYIHVWSEKIV